MSAPQPPSTHSQNFFRSPDLVDWLLDRSSIQRGDLVLDLGAGTGLIADRLARRGCRVLAVENDPTLTCYLDERFADITTVRVVHADTLEVQLPHQPYKVFSNIPFDASAAIVGRLTGAAWSPEDAYLVMQREAAERFIGQPRATLVSVLLAPWFAGTQVHQFRRTDFTPAPHVEVVMLRLHKRGPPLVSVEHAQVFRDFVISAFTRRNTSVSGSLVRLIGARRARRVAAHVGLAEIVPSRLPPERWVEVFQAVLACAAHDLDWRVAGAEWRLRSQQRRLHKIHRTRARRLRPPPSFNRTVRGPGATQHDQPGATTGTGLVLPCPA
jgi:23S rRNA (adenine-N6)-dimethyltransferase